MKQSICYLLMLFSCLIAGCAQDQSRIHRWSNHPNLLIAAPSTAGFVSGFLAGKVVNASASLVVGIVALPFGRSNQAMDLFYTNEVQLAGPTLGTYLIGAPFYSLFGWWGPGNISTEKLRMLASEKNGRLQSLHNYRIYGSDLKGVDLSGIDFFGCDFHGIDFSGANLSNAILYRADLGGAIFQGTNLQNADLRRVYLVGADLRGADLSGADLSGPETPNLSTTSLQDVRLTGANFSNVQLQRVEGLSVEELQKAKNWQSAVRSNK